MDFAAPLTDKKLRELQAQFEAWPNHQVVMNAINSNGINQTAKNATVLRQLNRTFSDEVQTGKVSNQKQSGRCWLFSILNTLRHRFAAQYNVKDFELSQSYLFFWDKIERANMFYARMIALADRPLSDREVSFYLDSPDDDGGQWAMAAALVAKYGVVPRETFPENAVTESTGEFADLLNRKLRKDGLALRKLIHDGASDDEIMGAKDRFLTEVYQITASAIGVPPERFDLEYRDDDNHYHLDQGLTPQAFYQKYIGVDLNDYVVLSNAPDKDYYQIYTLPSQDNVINGLPIQFLNLPMEELKQAAIHQLQDQETVWFGNDVLKQADRKAGLLDSDLYLQDKLLDVDTRMSKQERFETHEAEVSHAMTLTGVDLINGAPQKWKVENSWGDKVGKDGYFVMGDNWMNDYVYEVVVERKYLTEKQQAALKAAPIVLPPWDSLA
ncbi:C1 family peptidase [Fructilactobacillus hinvesii]|uniref:Aminopeptidase n=1 Tax=Fructilactobacillus hinvesii TaxID=2940300 RepID=A0ABY5BSR3_9LACO|nr:C1 family peptidase [Fructilactobacillus hinvesii]USS88163.1 C1 family peptidase [Fructilactobacillus hinvesii]